MSEPTSESSPESSDWSGTERIGEFVAVLPEDGQWHSIRIAGRAVEVKNYGVFGRWNEGENDGNDHSA